MQNVKWMQHEITLQRELQNVMTKNVFLDKEVKTQQQNKKANLKTHAKADIET